MEKTFTSEENDKMSSLVNAFFHFLGDACKSETKFSNNEKNTHSHWEKTVKTKKKQLWALSITVIPLILVALER